MTPQAMLPLDLNGKDRLTKLLLRLYHVRRRFSPCVTLRVMGMSPQLEALYEPVLPQLNEVRDMVRAFWADALQLVHGPELDSPDVTGKMLRPALCLLSAGALGGRDVNRFSAMAAAFEILHLAALTHDDVIDSAHLRRGATSLNVLWDDHAAVLGGDYLVARATLLLAAYNSCPLIANVVESVCQMAEGELRSLTWNPRTVTREDCVRLAEQKTASLFASTCTGPTFVLDTAHREALHRYGMGFGIAFQLVDDILDLSQTEAALGKPSCGDIVEGKATLPILFMRMALSPKELARLDQVGRSSLGDTDREWIAAKLEQTGARAQTEALARQYMDEARQALHTLPRTPHREAMEALLEFVLVRAS
jgi:octaprenyl-diphosphate synthase